MDGKTLIGTAVFILVLAVAIALGLYLNRKFLGG